jgi:signal transduction histidine kinase
VRSLCIELRPADLDDLGLMPALRSYLDRQARRAGLVAEIVTGASPERLPPEVETACYRLVQEAVTNVIRHAGARHVRVEIDSSGAAIDVLVRDDGSGFDVAAVRRRAGHGGSLGLLGMEERVALLGGTMAIESAPDRGTTIRAHLPLTAHGPRLEADERGGAA